MYQYSKGVGNITTHSFVERSGLVCGLRVAEPEQEVRVRVGVGYSMDVMLLAVVKLCGSATTR